MNNNALLLIVMILAAIIPALIVYCVVWMRQVADERRIDSALGSSEDVVRVEQEQKELNLALSKLDARINSLQESFASLNNKIIARNRVENKNERKQKESDEGEEDEFLKKNQTTLFPFPAPTAEQPPASAVKPRFVRKVG